MEAKRAVPKSDSTSPTPHSPSEIAVTVETNNSPPVLSPPPSVTPDVAAARVESPVVPPSLVVPVPEHVPNATPATQKSPMIPNHRVFGENRPPSRSMIDNRTSEFCTNKIFVGGLHYDTKDGELFS